MTVHLLDRAHGGRLERRMECVLHRGTPDAHAPSPYEDDGQGNPAAWSRESADARACGVMRKERQRGARNFPRQSKSPWRRAARSSAPGLVRLLAETSRDRVSTPRIETSPDLKTVAGLIPTLRWSERLAVRVHIRPATLAARAVHLSSGTAFAQLSYTGGSGRPRRRGSVPGSSISAWSFETDGYRPRPPASCGRDPAAIEREEEADARSRCGEGDAGRETSTTCRCSRRSLIRSNETVRWLAWRGDSY